MRAVWAPLTGAFAVALTTIALLPASTEAQQSVTVNLTAQNNSGQAGTAVLTSEGAATRVVITLSNAPGPHPAHIHSGACPTPGAVVFPLTSVANGRSETTVAASIADILRAPHAINVHKSPQEIPVYTSCGNVTAAARAGGSPGSGGPGSGSPGRPAVPGCQAGRTVAGPGRQAGPGRRPGPGSGREARRRLAGRRSRPGAASGRLAGRLAAHRRSRSHGRPLDGGRRRRRARRRRGAPDRAAAPLDLTPDAVCSGPELAPTEEGVRQAPSHPQRRRPGIGPGRFALVPRAAPASVPHGRIERPPRASMLELLWISLPASSPFIASGATPS